MTRRVLPRLAMLATVILAGAGIMRAVAEEPANEHFQRTWARTDRPVAEGVTPRTWMWGPDAFTSQMSEVYAESPGGQRAVQYFDKARMEINDPDGDPASAFFVTNGLLVVELIGGRMQTGDNSFVDLQPGEVNVAGDPSTGSGQANDPSGPMYASFGGVLDAAPLPLGTAVTQRIDRAGTVTSDPALAGQGVVAGVLDEVTKHAIAAPFWSFMNSTGAVYENGQFSEDELFENPYFATGRPVTEAYWADVLVAGTERLVLMQCFERRCLTYTPGNPEGFIVEAGNVGQHYYAWRYPAPSPDPTSTPTATATGTIPPSPTATETPTATSSPTPTATSSPTPTATEEPPSVINVEGPDGADATYAGQNGFFAQTGVVFSQIDTYPATLKLFTGVYFGVDEFVSADAYLRNTITATRTGTVRVTADVRWNGELWTFGIGDMYSDFQTQLLVGVVQPGQSIPSGGDYALSDIFSVQSPTATNTVVGGTELTVFVNVNKGDEIRIAMHAICTSRGSFIIFPSDSECDFYEGARHVELRSLTIEYLE